MSVSEHYKETPVDRFVQWYKYHLDFVALVVLGVIALIVIFVFEPEMTRFRALFLLACAALSPYGYVFGSWLSGWLYDQMTIFVIELRVEEEGSGALHEFPPGDFEEWDCVEDSLDQWAPFLYCARAVDYENQAFTGTWRGSLTDRELLIALSQVRKCRGMLETDAKVGFAYSQYVDLIVPRGVRETVSKISSWKNEHRLPDEGEALDEAIDEVMGEFGLADVVEQVDSFEDVADNIDGVDGEDVREFVASGPDGVDAGELDE